jgi:hypothetical protein
LYFQLISFTQFLPISPPSGLGRLSFRDQVAIEKIVGRAPVILADMATKMRFMAARISPTGLLLFQTLDLRTSASTVGFMRQWRPIFCAGNWPRLISRLMVFGWSFKSAAPSLSVTTSSLIGFHRRSIAAAPVCRYCQRASLFVKIRWHARPQIRRHVTEVYRSALLRLHEKIEAQ